MRNARAWHGGIGVLHAARSDVIIATMVSSEVGTEPNDRGSSRGHIMDSVAGRSPGRRPYDLYQIHMSDPLTPEEETLRALDDLVSQRLVRYIGCSNSPAWRIAKALVISAQHGRAKFDTVQAYYSIAGRDLEREIVPMIADQKVGLLVWLPLAGGLVSGKLKPADARRAQMDFPIVVKERWACIDAMRSIARNTQPAWRALRLPGYCQKGFVTSIVSGAKTIEQLNDNLGASALELSAAELASLDAISELPREYPGWMAYKGINRSNVLELDQEAGRASGYS